MDPTDSEKTDDDKRKAAYRTLESYERCKILVEKCWDYFD
jgi:hypothetical protein